MDHYGIKDAALAWFSSYLSGRVQRVCINKDVSTWNEIPCGVPQGSILGPLMFIIYLNDLPHIEIPSCCYMGIYADDVILYTSSSSIAEVQSSLQASLTALRDWTLSNKMSLNATKTHSMLFGTRQRIGNQSLNLLLNGKPILQVQSAKYLGMDPQLTWREHTIKTISKARSRIHAINRLKPLPGHLLIRLYRAFVMPILEYCDVVWTPPKTLLDKLDSLHLRSMRQFGLSGASDVVHSRPSIRRRFHMSLQAFKIMHKTCPQYLHDTLVYSEDVTNRSARNKFVFLYLPSELSLVGNPFILK